MKVHNHAILTKLQIPSHAWDEQVAWVNGYILALEDILGDLGKQVGTTDWPEEAILALELAQDHVGVTLTQARATLAAMKEMEDEAVAGDLRGSTPARGSSEAPDPEDQGRVSDPGAV